MMLLVADEHHRPTQQPQFCATQFTLWHACGWGTVPSSVAIAFLLLGIEEIGVQVEEPFAILPLGAPCLPRPCRLYVGVCSSPCQPFGM